MFGYLGLTNSRIQVDYSLPILDLFVAALADYLLSAGFITEDLRPYKKRYELIRTQATRINCNDMVAPLLAFDLDPSDPVVNLLLAEVVKFFALGIEEGIVSSIVTTWWFIQRSGIHMQDFQTFIDEEHKFEFKYIGSVCVRIIKFVASEGSTWYAWQKKMAARNKLLAEEDAELQAGEGGESKKYSEWVAHARRISEQMWQRFQESGEEEGDLEDNEAWTLIA